MKINKMSHRITIMKPISGGADEGFGEPISFTSDGDVWAEFLRVRIVPTAMIGSGETVETTQGMRIRPRQIEKGWKIIEGEHTYKVLHVDTSTPGEIILTTKEVDP